MSRNRILLCLGHLSGKEQKYVQEAFDSNWVAPLGPNVVAFEKTLEEFVGQGKSVVALNSGTSAVHLALLACAVGPGDEVIVQSFTFCASSNPVVYLGATPVFVDSETDTWNMDPVLLQQAIEARLAATGKLPKAIIPVALYGMPYKVDEVLAVANRYGIPVIEDAAEGFGSRYNGRVLGTFGDYGVLSFNGNKMITTSGGGALICPNRDAADRVLWYATQARESFSYYQHETIGYNYRMSNICAGIGRGQMFVLDEHVAHHQHIASLYHEAFKAVDGIEFHAQPEGLGMASNYWLANIVISPDLRIKGQQDAYHHAIRGAVGGAAGVVHHAASLVTDCQPNDNVEALRLWLDSKDIEARPLWKPMHKQPVYRSSPAFVNGVSEKFFSRGLCLPSGPLVSDDDVQYVVKSIVDSIV